ncbi:MAG: prolyl oligopeptidase family serine peptidase [Aggregatilineales bacterium]
MSHEKRPIKVDDLTKIQHVDDPQFSPDGKWIAYVLTTPDTMEQSYKRNIYLVSAEGGNPLQLTYTNKDSNPRWSPDGKQLAFVSGRAGKPQIYLLPTTAPGGEAKILTSAKNGATTPVWSPDGSQLAYLARMNMTERAAEDSDEKDAPPEDKLAGKHRKEREEHDEKERFDPRPMTRIPYRTGTAFLDDRFGQIYVVSVAEDASNEDKKARRLTDVDANHSPPHWTPDNKTLYTTRSVNPDGDEPWLYHHAFSIDVATGENTQITDDATKAVYDVDPSPDGKWLVIQQRDVKRLAKNGEFIIKSTETDETRQINRVLDRNNYGNRWTDDNQLLYLVASEGDYIPYRYDPATDTSEPTLTGTYMVTGFSPDKNGNLALSISTPMNPSELYLLAADSTLTALTEVNKAFLDDVIVQDAHEFHFESPSGDTIQGWYILPVGYEDGEKYPLALNIHGGPRVMWGSNMRSMWHEWQLHAARGYAVFYCNPRGGDGYGEAFREVLIKNWGDVAMMDVMAGVDTLIEKGIVDEDRMAITGGSYGGYMTTWIIGHSNRFKSAVSQRGVYNLFSFYGTSDVPFLISSDFETEPWENPELLKEHSPISYVQEIAKTPLLLIHGENDYRVPIEQAEQMFAQVRRSGGTVAMLRYPREGHELSRTGEPAHRISRLSEMVDWFDKYCMPDRSS